MPKPTALKLQAVNQPCLNVARSYLKFELPKQVDREKSNDLHWEELLILSSEFYLPLIAHLLEEWHHLFAPYQKCLCADTRE